MAQQERAVRTRQAVLNAAATVFAENGYAATTVADILSLAGVTKGALYFHFDSKEALAKGVLAEQTTGQELVPQELKLQEWVDSGMVLAHQMPLDPILRAGARLSSDLNGQKRYGNAFPAWAEVSAGMLAEAQERGEVLPHVVPMETAELVVGSYYGVQTFSQLSSNWADLEVRISTMLRHVLPAIAAPAILPRLDTAPDRGARIVAEARERADNEAELVQTAS